MAAAFFVSSFRVWKACRQTSFFSLPKHVYFYTGAHHMRLLTLGGDYFFITHGYSFSPRCVGLRMMDDIPFSVCFFSGWSGRGRFLCRGLSQDDSRSNSFDGRFRTRSSLFSPITAEALRYRLPVFFFFIVPVSIPEGIDRTPEACPVALPFFPSP